MAFLQLVPLLKGYKIAAKREKTKTMAKTDYKFSVSMRDNPCLFFLQAVTPRNMRNLL